MKLSKRSKRLLIWGSPLVIILIVVIIKMSGSDEEQTMVQADLVVLDDISEVVTASGRIQPQTKVDIVAEVSAEIIDLKVKEGDWVTRGQTLLLLDTIQAMSDAQQARFSLDELTSRTEAARTQYEMDKQEFDRQARLFAQNLTSDMEHTNARLRYENNKANHEAMLAQARTGKARLDKALDNLTKTRITSPMDGMVTFLNAEVGEIAQAQTSFTQGRTLMTISDLSVFDVEVDVDETEIAKVDTGQRAKIRVDAFRDTAFEGTVAEIGNSALISGEGSENYTTSFRVKVRFQEAEAGVRPGMSATVDITTATAENALTIPYASVVTREIDPDSLKRDSTAAAVAAESSSTSDAKFSSVSATDGAVAAEAAEEPARPKKKKEKIKQSGVFKVENGLARFVEIQTGIADERNVVALSNLTPGDTIVSGSFQTLRKLSDGDVVKIDEDSIERMKKENE